MLPTPLLYHTASQIIMNLEAIASEIRNFEGVTRKKSIADIAEILGTVRSEYTDCIADIGDDAAIIDIGGDDVLLFAADGIWSAMLGDPWWAGYGAVLVNVNDISAMGGRPIGMVNILATDNKETLAELVRGIRDGVAKFGVPMVGGHLHPDTPYTSSSVAIVGIAKRDAVIRSDTAEAGDAIVLAYDLDGRVGKNSIYSWDSTTMKTAASVREKFMVMQTLGERGLVTSGKDISNPGTIGTLGMLLETSRKGASVDITAIPRPGGVDFVHWLKIYPATGYVVTTRDADECVRVFEAAGLDAAVVGVIDDGLCLDIYEGDDRVTVFDFGKDVITGIRVNRG
ncbi:MAG: Thiamine-monophosphate kinase [ANME-2 cluster archaeon]|nr:Thiamine-monophosphate kinase [ANME-2 cluster archaeon]